MGNDNARRHGYYAKPAPAGRYSSPPTIEAIMTDLAEKQHTLSEFIAAQPQHNRKTQRKSWLFEIAQQFCIKMMLRRIVVSCLNLLLVVGLKVG